MPPRARRVSDVVAARMAAFDLQPASPSDEAAVAPENVSEGLILSGVLAARLAKFDQQRSPPSNATSFVIPQGPVVLSSWVRKGNAFNLFPVKRYVVLHEAPVQVALYEDEECKRPTVPNALLNLEGSTVTLISEVIHITHGSWGDRPGELKLKLNAADEAKQWHTKLVQLLGLPVPVDHPPTESSGTTPNDLTGPVPLPTTLEPTVLSLSAGAMAEASPHRSAPALDGTTTGAAPSNAAGTAAESQMAEDSKVLPVDSTSLLREAKHEMIYGEVLQNAQQQQPSQLPTVFPVASAPST